MNARHQITVILKQWLQLTHGESHALQFSRWAEIAKIQRAKDLLQEPMSEAIVRWRLENPQEAAWSLIHHEVCRLRELEAQHSELLAVRKREVREKILLIEQALYDICRFRPATAHASQAA